MSDALHIAATGMQAQQLQLEAIASNMANVSTPAYKKTRVSFADLVVRDTAATAASQAPARAGAGVSAAAITRVFDAGEIRKTESPFDVAIQGEGFLEVMLADGARGFTRGGTLKVNADGQLATVAGHPLKPGVHVPSGAQDLVILADGRVQVRMTGQSTPMEIGQLELVRLANPHALRVQGDGIYRHTEAAGDGMGARPGEEGVGTLAQGFLEGSNVKLVDEMVSLMIAQRSYEASVKVVQAADEMMGLVNGLRR